MDFIDNRKKTLLQKINKFRIDRGRLKCWGWRGAVCSGGYPRIFFEGSSIGAHRATWISVYGEIPKFHYVRHRCGNKECTNPEHLFISTKKGSLKPKDDRKSYRIGRSRLNLDLPEKLVEDIKTAARKYNQTVTKYVGRRLFEVMMFEKKE